MTRIWTAFLDAVDNVLSLPLAVLLLLLVAVLTGVLLYFYPRWIPRRWPRIRFRLRRPRFRRRSVKSWFSWRRKKKVSEEDEPEAEETVDESESVPELPAATFVSLADRLAAEGRFAEAVRERLRGMVRGLVERGVIEHVPGWTVTELATAAGAARPEVGPPLREASRLFSDIWYGEQQAFREQDERMRQLATDVTAALETRRPAGVPA